ncbi:MAG: RDD family protein [Acidimicrobiales bacterium]
MTQMAPVFTEPPTAPDSLPPAGPGSMPSIWLRVAARLFDGLVMLVPMFAVALPYLTVVDPDDPTGSFPHWVRITWVVAPLVYEFVFLAWRGATPGKMLFGIAVFDIADGRRPAAYQAGLRVLLPGLGGVLGLVVTSGGLAELADFVAPAMYLFAVYHPLRRGLHDRAAGTIVLRTR